MDNSVHARGKAASMSTSEASLRVPGREVRHFASYHKWDRDFFLLWVALIWLGVSVGFGRQIAEQVETHQSAPPHIVFVHAAVFIGWLLLLTVQVLLVRSRRVNIHRRLGIAGMVLAVLVVMLGAAVALTMARLRFGAHGTVPPILSFQLAEMLGFTGLSGAAFLLTRQPAAHKRLILLATLYISGAGFARLLGWDGVPLPWLFDVRGGASLGHFWPDWAAFSLANDVLILGLGVYDWITRRRLHPAYIAGAAYIAVLQLTAVALMVDPLWKLWKLWKPVAISLLAL
jgi:hypothetical protein